ncbi:MAG: 1-acyl-sn-glycerol-3-phosphate acyltransferase [Albidovulum sp.]
MFQTVTLPLWLLVLILVFAGVTFASHFLFPSVRWFFRGRMEKAVARLNQRLERPIQPFKLMARPDMIMRLVHDPQVAAAVAEEAAQTGEPEAVVLERARRYAREIVPSFSATAYFGFGIRASKWFARTLYRVHLDDSRLGQIDPDATVIFVINHRSNMDYVLVTYLAARRSALSYAVGEWARVWPLSSLIRTMGAYFIRRRSDRPLYRRVLARYVQMATAAGVTQAIFPEGGLSLDGRVGAAKLGLLSYVVGGREPGGRDVVFVPVALNYDRVLEDRVLTAAHAAGKRRFRAPLTEIFAFIGRHIWRAMRGRFRRFGDAVVSFGAPVSLQAFAADAKADVAPALAAHLMAEIVRNMPIVSVPLVASAWGEAAMTDVSALTDRTAALAERLEARGAGVRLPKGGAAAAVAAALEIFAMRRMIAREGDLLRLVPEHRALIDFYAASVHQILDADAASTAPKKPGARRKSKSDPT